MLNFWVTLLAVMIVAGVVLFPISMWFGEILTHDPEYFRQWIHQRFSLSVKGPQIAVASTLGIVPVTTTAAVMVKENRLQTTHSSDVRFDIKIVGVGGQQIIYGSIGALSR